MRDLNGEIIREGDTVSFCYGIPPIGVTGPVVKIGKRLWIRTPGHNPDKILLSEAVKYFSVELEKRRWKI